ncbi:MAG: hypothetical protein ACI9LY_003184 [Arenicella sp.]|jgi:hypothetical protein
MLIRYLSIMSDSRKSDLDQRADRLLTQRAIEPDARKLAEKIILASQNLPQGSAQTASRFEWLTHFKPLFAARLYSNQSLVFSSAIACLMVAVIAGVWFTPQPGIMKPQSATQNIVVIVDSLSEEFSWDSLLIMEDELAFAGL